MAQLQWRQLTPIILTSMETKQISTTLKILWLRAPSWVLLATLDRSQSRYHFIMRIKSIIYFDVIVFQLESKNRNSAERWAIDVSRLCNTSVCTHTCVIPLFNHAIPVVMPYSCDIKSGFSFSTATWVTPSLGIGTVKEKQLKVSPILLSLLPNSWD